MKLIDTIASQNLIAFRIIQSYINNISIAKVSVYNETLTKTYTTDISKQVIIDNTGGRKSIHDNFALEPITWKIRGFLKPYGYEFSFYFQPSLKSQINKLEEARNTRDTIEFKDKYGKIFNVGIETMEIEENAECQNGIPISFTLFEVTKQNALSATLSAAESAGIPKAGTENGPSGDLGTSSGGKPTSIGFSLSGLPT